MFNLAGEMLHRELAETLFNRFQGQHLRNLYGLFETTTYPAWIILWWDEGLAAHVGHPIPNRRIYVLDGDGQPVPIGVAVDLYIGGAAGGAWFFQSTRADSGTLPS